MSLSDLGTLTTDLSKIGTILRADFRYENSWVSQELGGIALNDTSGGLDYQIWTAVYIERTKEICLSADNTPPIIIATNVNTLRSLSLAFDQNMQYFIAWMTVEGNCFYRWFDVSLPGYRTSALSNAEFPIAVLDIKDNLFVAQSDILLFYTNTALPGPSKNLYCRVQRQNYAVENLLYSGLPGYLFKAGMSDKNRIQFEFIEYYEPVEHFLRNSRALNL
jgi:hypothetical protein